MSGTAKSFWVERGPPRSSTAILSPVEASSLERMPPVQPMPTMTMSTGGSLVAMMRSSLLGHVDDADRVGGKPLALAEFFYVLGVVGQDAREADHLPTDLVLVAAIDRIGKQTLHHVFVEHAEEHAAGQAALECDLAVGQVLEKRLLLRSGAGVKILAEGFAAIGIRALDADAIKLGRRERGLVALVGRPQGPRPLHVEAVALAPAAGERAIDVDVDADVGTLGRELVGGHHVIDQSLHERR